MTQRTSHRIETATDVETDVETATEKKVCVSLRSVAFSYSSIDAQPTTVLEDFNLDVHQGDFVTLIGPSGCGKTTLLRLIAGLEQPLVGDVVFQGQHVDGPNHKRGVVFQQGSLFPWLTVSGNVAFGLKSRGVAPSERTSQVAEILDLVGMSAFAQSYPHEISGGMAQRVAIARTLVNDPDLVLLDEPMGALDSFTRQSLQSLILQLHQRLDMTMILVTHDIDEAVFMSDRIVVMTSRPGRIIESLPVTLPEQRMQRDRSSAKFFEIRSSIMTLLSDISA
ncbi:ABC transporter ATP-binding protein [Bifidobacterium aquikefiri]|uniref:ABC transporter ATP-binding protein n=1 Tax=Bifidobacterium aquikefiri TaxID=1653207 RepID=UPI0039E8897F